MWAARSARFVVLLSRSKVVEEEEYEVEVCPDCEGEPSHMDDDCDTCQNDGWVYRS